MRGPPGGSKIPADRRRPCSRRCSRTSPLSTAGTELLLLPTTCLPKSVIQASPRCRRRRGRRCRPGAAESGVACAFASGPLCASCTRCNEEQQHRAAVQPLDDSFSDGTSVGCSFDLRSRAASRFPRSPSLLEPAKRRSPVESTDFGAHCPSSCRPSRASRYAHDVADLHRVSCPAATHEAVRAAHLRAQFSTLPSAPWTSI